MKLGTVLQNIQIDSIEKCLTSSSENKGDIYGHPVAFVSEVGSTIYECIDIGTASSSFSRNSKATSTGTRINYPQSSSSRIVQVKVSSATLPSISSSSSSLAQGSVNRRLLAANECLSLLSHWPQNRHTLWTALGSSFPSVLVGTFVTMTSNLELLSDRLAIDTFESTKEDMQDTIQYLLHSVNMFSRFVTSFDVENQYQHQCQQQHQLDNSTQHDQKSRCDSLYIPTQPWSSAIWKELGCRSVTSSTNILLSDRYRDLYNCIKTHSSSTFESTRPLGRLGNAKNIQSTLLSYNSANLDIETRRRNEIRRVDIEFSNALKIGGLQTSCIILIDTLRILMDKITNIALETIVTADQKTQLSSMYVSCLVLQIETLHLLVECLDGTEQSVADMIESEFDVLLGFILNVSLSYDERLDTLDFSMCSQVGRDTVSDLILKRGMLVIEINETMRIQLHSKSSNNADNLRQQQQEGNEESREGYLSIEDEYIKVISDDVIASFLTWVSKRSTSVLKAKESHINFDDVNKLSFSIECPREFSTLTKRTTLMFMVSGTGQDTSSSKASYHVCKSLSSVVTESTGTDLSDDSWVHVYQLPGAAIWTYVFDIFVRGFFNPSISLSEETIEKCIHSLVDIVLKHLHYSNDPSNRSAYTQDGQTDLPICQFYFIKVLILCIQLYPHFTLKTLRKIKVWAFLFGEFFLYGGSGDVCLLGNKTVFDLNTEFREDGSAMNTTWTITEDAMPASEDRMNIVRTSVWLALKDLLLDFTYKVVEFSFGSELFNEIDPNMEINMIHSSLVEHASKPTFMTLLASYQVIKWLQRLYIDYGELISNSGNYHFRSCCMQCCFDMLAVHSDILSLSKRAANLSVNTTPASQSRKQSPSTTLLSSIGALLDHSELVWASRASIIDLLSILLVDTQFHDNTDWLDLFYISNSEIIVQHEKKKLILNSKRESSQMYGFRTSVSPKTSKSMVSNNSVSSSIQTSSETTLQSPVNPSSASLSPHLYLSVSVSPKPRRRSETSESNSMQEYSAGKARIKSLESLLLDPKCHSISVSLLMKIVAVCSKELCPKTDTLGYGRTPHLELSYNKRLIYQPSEAINNKESCQARFVGIFIIERLIDIIRGMLSSQKGSDRVSIAHLCIKSMCDILYECDFDSYLQEIFRKSDVIAGIIESLKLLVPTTRKSVAVKQSTDQMTNDDSDFSIRVLRQSLILFTYLTKGNDSMKSYFANHFITSKSITSVGSKDGSTLGSVQNKSPVKDQQHVAVSAEAFVNLLLEIESSISLDTLLLFFEMLVDQHISERDDYDYATILLSGLPGDSEDGTKTMSNNTALMLLCQIIPFSEISLQKFILKSLTNLVSNCKAALVNLAACAKFQPPLLDAALDLFQDVHSDARMDLVLLIQKLGQHSISVSQMKHLFRIMQLSGEYRPNYNYQVLEALKGMIGESNGPRHSFVFNGLNSGIQLPSITTWPAKKGFTFTTWFNIERSQQQDSVSNVGTVAEERYLMSFRGISGSGFDVRLQKVGTHLYSIVINSFGDNGKVLEAPICTNYHGLFINVGQWHFLGVGFKQSVAFRSKAEVSVAVDDTFHSQPFAFPGLNESIPKPCIGTGLSLSGAIEVNKNKLFRGQMAAINMFSDYLSRNKLLGIFELGSGYFYGFETYTLEYADVRKLKKKKNLTVAPETTLDGSLNEILIISYNPAVVEGDLVIDNAPIKVENILLKSLKYNSDSLLNQGMNATALAGTSLASTKDAMAALDALGGAKALLPLFMQLDQPRIDFTRTVSRLQTQTNIQEGADTKLSKMLLELLRAILDMTADNDRIGQNLVAFSLIEYFLPNISSNHLDFESYHILIDIYHRMPTESPVQESLLENLFFRCDIWRSAPLDVQVTLVSWLTERLVTENRYTQEILSSQKLLENLHTYYEYDIINTATAATSAKVSERSGIPSVTVKRPSIPSLQSPLPLSRISDFTSPRLTSSRGIVYNGTLLTHSELKRIRSAWYDLILLSFARMSFTIIEDVHVLVGYILNAKSPVSKSEDLSLLFMLLCPSENEFVSQLVLRALASPNCLHPLVALCESPNASVRLKAILLFCKILEMANHIQILPVVPNWSSPLSTPRPSDVRLSDLSSYRSDREVPDHRYSIDATTDSPRIYDSRVTSSKSTLSPRSMLTDTVLHTDRSGSVASPSSFEEFGLNFDQLTCILSSMKSRVFSVLNQQIQNNSAYTTLASIECEVIICILKTTLFGNELDYKIVEQIDELDFDNLGKYNNERDVKSPSIFMLHLSDTDGSISNDMKIQFPALFCMLIEFITNPICLQPLRLSVLCHLKACLSSLTNCDIIIGLSNWQVSIFQLIIFEHSAMKLSQAQLMTCEDKSAESKVIEKSITKSETILDSCLRIICEIHAAAIRLGRPFAPPSVALQKDSINFITAKQLVQEVSRGQRQIGVTVLRDTIAVLRLFGQQGDLDIQDTGYALLLQTMTVLERELESGQAAIQDHTISSVSCIDGTDDETSLLYIQKTFQLNIWLVASLVLDFLTIPSIQGRKMDGSEPARVTSPGSSQVSPRDDRPRSGRLPSDRSPSNVQLAESLSPINLAMTESWMSNKSPHTATINDGEWSNSVSSLLFDITKAQASLNTSTKSIGGDAAFDSGGPVTESDDNASLRENAVWLVIDRLMSLLDTLEIGAANEQSTSQSIGLNIFSGARAAARMTGEVENIIQPLTQSTQKIQQILQSRAISQPKPFNLNLKINPFMSKTPLSHATGGVCWIIMRVLTSLLLNCFTWKDKQFIVSADSLVIMNRLQKLIEYCINKDVEFCTFESINIAFKLVEILRTAQIDNGNRPIIREILIFIFNLAKSNRDVLVEFIQHCRKDQSLVSSNNSVDSSSITSRKKVVVISSSRGMAMSTSYSKSTGSIVSSDVIGDILSAFDTSVLQDVLKDDNISNRKPDDQSTTSHNESINISTILLQGLSGVLQIYGFEINWSLWSLLSNIISAEAKRMDEESIDIKLNELGFHKHAQAMKMTIAVQAAMVSRGADEWQIRTNEVTKLLDNLLHDKLIASSRIQQHKDRRNQSRWMSVLSEIANERGCWGYSADPNRRVFWMQDTVETSNRLRPRLKRNEFGSRHQIASRLSSSYRSPQSINADELDTLAVTSVGKKAFGIWKDLIKYKTSTKKLVIPSEEDVVDDIEQFDDQDTAMTGTVDATGQEQQLYFREICEVITIASNFTGGRTSGVFEVTKSKLSFHRKADMDSNEFKPNSHNDEFVWVYNSYPSTSWHVGEIVGVYSRHYLMQFTAIEIFFTSRTSVFINFFEIDAAKEFYKCMITRAKPPLFIPPTNRKPEALIKSTIHNRFNTTWTQAWVTRKISNFDYLMALNSIAGRTFNDAGQYPVFPWILKDYTSKILNLRDPNTFRNLAMPVGAQTEAQRINCLQRYKDGTELYETAEDFPPFHHGSHYSCMGFVFWYLIRLEPYTSLAVWLQDGKFDHSDRMFHSIKSAWESCQTNNSDVKELIPEFYSCTEFLENMNDIDLGVTQSGRRVNTVELPQWCNGNVEEFIRLHREALECDYVSQNLHHWIDLIFGYKQRPKMFNGTDEAIESFNVFFHLTYSGAVNLTEIKAKDDDLYNRTMRQIDNYGQTPCQLFHKHHPKRLPFSQLKIVWPIASCVLGVDTVMLEEELPKMPNHVVSYPAELVSSSPIIFIMSMSKSSRLLSIDINRVMGLHSFSIKEPDVVPPFHFKFDQNASRISMNLGVTAATGKQEQSSFLSRMSTGSINISHRDYFVGVPFSPSGLSTKSSSSFYYNLEYFDPRLIGTSENKRLYSIDKLDTTRKVETIRMTPRRHSTRSSVSSNESTSVLKIKSATETIQSNTSDSKLVHSNRKPAEQPVSSSSTSSDDGSPVSANATRSPGLPFETALVSPTDRKRREKRSAKYIKDYPQGKEYDRSGNLFAALPDHKLLFSCGHWDYSVKVTAIDSGKLIQSLSSHNDVVTCIALAEDYDKVWLASGSRDCTLMIWEVCPDRANQPVSWQPIHILYGHDDAITTVAINAELDLVVSGSDDGTIIIYSLRQGIFYHSIRAGFSSLKRSNYDMDSDHTKSNVSRNLNSSLSASEIQLPSGLLTIKNICISKDSIVLFASDGRVHFLFTYSINGKLIASIETEERLFCMCLSEDGKVLLTGGERCLVVFRWVHNLRLANDGPRRSQHAILDGAYDGNDNGYFQSAIRYLHLTPKESLLIVGLDSGHVQLLAQVNFLECIL